MQKWLYERFGEYVEDFRFQPEESAVETEEPLSARRWALQEGPPGARPALREARGRGCPWRGSPAWLRRPLGMGLLWSMCMGLTVSGGCPSAMPAPLWSNSGL